MKNAVTWMAHSIIKINLEILKSGKYPNGSRVDKKAIEELNEEIENSQRALADNGINAEQLTMF